MLFGSQVFLLGFLPLSLMGFFGLGRYAGPRAALVFLLGVSLFFYGWWNPPFVALLAGSIAANYALGERILVACGTRTARMWLAGGIVGNLALLGWFKYAGFLAGMFGARLDIFLPLAISFFTFQQIMFLVDRSRGELPHCGFVPYAAFIAFFPHLIAGPIVRPAEIIPQLTARTPARPAAGNLAEGLLRFLIGLGKKLVLADTFAVFANPGFDAAAHGATLTFVEAWVAVLAFALQLYFDFSGYSDMAIGLARMLNVRFPENFDSPYQARNIADFWRRWHMSLSRFLRDYLYVPLGGNRHGEARRLINLMLTMLLGGLWHGAAWNFLLWGGLHGAFLVVHGVWSRFGWSLPGWIAHALTLLAVITAWVPFRAEGFDTALGMLAAMAGLHGVALPQLIIGWVPALEMIATSVPVLAHLGDARTLALPEALLLLGVGWLVVLALPNSARMSEPARLGTLAAGFALTVQALFFAPHVSPFLYFRF